MSASDRTKRTIPVADDEEANRDLLTGLLEGAGCAVVCVPDGPGPLRASRERRVEAVSLDLMMPGKTGNTACAAQKSRPETRVIPVVLVSWPERRDEEVHGRICGAGDFLSKPLYKQERFAPVQFLVRIKQGICNRLTSPGLPQPGIRYHHEKLAGSSRPGGLPGKGVPLIAGILQIVDVFDAWTTGRPNRKALSTGQAFARGKEEVKPGWCDPSLVEQIRGLVAQSAPERATAGSQNDR